MSFRIMGTGSYLPPLSVTNDDIAKYVDTNDEWISTRTGIRSRHVATDETASEMGAKAALEALKDAGILADELDLILCATVSGEYIVPSMACLIQRAIGAHCPAFDMSSACSAFLVMMETAAAYLATGRYRRILLVGTEQMSRVLDWTDRSTCILFGDGAGAVVLEPGENYLGSHMVFMGGEEVLNLPTNVGNSPYWTLERPRDTVNMNGGETYKFATRTVPQEILALLEQTGTQQSEIDWVVCHQANQRIIDAVARRLKGIAPEKFLSNIADHGNTTAATIPLLLDECNKKGMFKRGDLMVVAAFGGGLSCIASLIRW